MDRITGSAVSVDLFGAGKDGFKNGDKANGIPATVVTAEFLNQVQEEIANVIEGAGITLDVNNRTQLKQAISVMLAGANTIARFTTTGNIALNGLATQGGGDWSGALTADDVIFVKDQATASENGWYAAAAGAWTRVVYLDESEEVKPSTLTKVSEGETLADTLWMLTTNAPMIVGSTDLVFTQQGTRFCMLPPTDMSGSRSLSTVYTNSKNYPITVSVSVQNNVSSPPCTLQGNVDGELFSSSTASLNTQVTSICFPVPPKSTYSVSLYASNSGFIKEWVEWR